MKRSLSVVNSATSLLICLFCLLQLHASAQSKAVIDKKAATTIAQSKTIKAKRARTSRSLQNSRQEKSKPRVFESRSQDDKKLKEIKDTKSKLRNGK